MPALPWIGKAGGSGAGIVNPLRESGNGSSPYLSTNFNRREPMT
jgi:hypothetical protein